MPTLTKEVEIEIDEDDLINCLADKDWDELIDFIKDVDNIPADWDFTKKLIQTMYKAWREDNPTTDLELSDIVVKGKRVEDEEDDEEPEEDDDEEEGGEEVQAEAGEEDHSHIYRDGQCYCGALP